MSYTKWGGRVALAQLVAPTRRRSAAELALVLFSDLVQDGCVQTPLEPGALFSGLSSDAIAAR